MRVRHRVTSEHGGEMSPGGAGDGCILQIVVPHAGRHCSDLSCSTRIMLKRVSSVGVSPSESLCQNARTSNDSVCTVVKKRSC